MKRRFLWLVLLVCVTLLPSLAWAWSGKVIGVIDGDSIKVLHDGRQEQIRLWGIDCPEKNQDFGTKAKQATSTLVFAKTVEVEPVTIDRYARTVAFVRVGDILVNEELIRQGPSQAFWLPSLASRQSSRRISSLWRLGASGCHWASIYEVV